MSRESVTIKVSPNEYQINAKIKRYELFGWEVVGNQRMQQFMGQTTEPNSSGGYNVYNNYETYSTLTFSREKSKSWYNKIVELENEYISLEKKFPIKPVPFSFFVCLILLLLLIVPGIIYIRLYVLEKRAYEEAMNNYIRNIRPRMKEIENEAKHLISTY